MLRKDLGLTYRRINPQVSYCYTDKNLILRQKFAQVLISVLESSKQLVSIDESSFDRLNYKRYCWQLNSESNHFPMTTTFKRTSLTAAIRSDGSCYHFLQQGSNNSCTTVYFLGKLFEIFDKEDSEWKTKTVLFLDNAPIHKSSFVRKWLL